MFALAVKHRFSLKPNLAPGNKQTQVFVQHLKKIGMSY